MVQEMRPRDLEHRFNRVALDVELAPPARDGGDPRACGSSRAMRPAIGLGPAELVLERRGQDSEHLAIQIVDRRG